MVGRGTTWGAIVLALIAAGGIGWWALYPRPSEEERIRAVIRRLERGVEDKAAARVLALVSPDYRDDYGWRRKDLDILALRLLRSHGRFEVNLRQTRLRIAGSRATVTLEGEVTLTARSPAGAFLEAKRRERGSEWAQGRYFGTLTLQLRRERGGWRIIGSRGWQERALLGLGDAGD